MELVDTHCHLTSLSHGTTEEILARAQEAFVTRCVSIGASDGLNSAYEALSLAKAHKNVWCSVGIHPHDAGNTIEIETLEDIVGDSLVVAIGETGLDFYRDWAPADKQRELFERTIAFARKHKKPLIIHSRSAGEECLETLTRLQARDVGGVFHCYAENAEFAKKLADTNFLVSYPGALTFKSAHAVREIAAAIPLEQIMLETDAPYMAPEPFRGKPNEPAHVLQIAQAMAKVKDISIQEVARVTTSTAKRFYNLPL